MKASASPISAHEGGEKRSQSLSTPLKFRSPYLAITDFSCFTMRARASCAGSLSVRRAPVSFGGPGRGTRSRGGFVRVRSRGPQDQAHFDLQSPLPPSVLGYSSIFFTSF